MSTERIGKLQASILGVLGSGARTLADLQKHFAAEYRHDNVARAVGILEHRGMIEDSHPRGPPGTTRRNRHYGIIDLTAAAKDMIDNGEVIASPVAPVARERGASKHVEYGALARAFLGLSSGDPLKADEVFPSRVGRREFALRTMETLQRLGLIEPVSNDRFVLKDPKAFRATWADEHLFCAVLGRECSKEQAESMSALLNGGSLREEAAAAAFLYNVIGQENTARRTGLSSSAVMALRRVAALAPEVQEAMEKRGLGARWILNFVHDASTAKLLAAMESGELLASIEPEPVQMREPADDGPGAAEMLATCLKLCAFTAEAVAGMERKLDFLAKELGYRGE